jgi:CubicO group peptidase (beta-lactamase class C family)
MKKLTTMVLSVIIALSLLLPGCGGEETPALVTYDFTPLTELIQNTVDTVPLDGAAMLVVKDGEVIYEEYFGEYTVDRVVGIASASKWLGAVTVMTLADQGLLSLDDPVSKYLPAFSDPDKADITIRQCLSHTSGLPEDCRSRWVPDITLMECSGEIAGLEMEATPGSVFAYGGTSLQVAGAVAEAASGKPWAEIFRENITEPCDMPDTSFPYPSPENPMIAGGAYTKLWDYAHFLEMLLNEGVYNGRQVLSAETVREIISDQTFGIGPYGLGCWRGEGFDGETIRASSPGALGYTPWIDLNRNMYAVFQIRNKGMNDVIEQIQVEVRNIVPSPVAEPEAHYMVEPAEERGPRPPEGPASAAEAKPGELFIEFTSQEPDPSCSDTDVTITCLTLPGATCHIQPINPALASGKRTISRWVEEPTLVADENGVVAWTWHLHRHVATGNGTVEISAELGDQQVMRDFVWRNFRPAGMVSTDNVTVATPPPPEETADVPIEIVSVSPQPAEPGNDPQLEVIIKTVPGATGNCTLVLPVTGTTGTRALPQADENGDIVWYWNIHRHVAAGDATFDFTLTFEGKASTKRYVVKFVK